MHPEKPNPPGLTRETPPHKALDPSASIQVKRCSARVLRPCSRSGLRSNPSQVLRSRSLTAVSSVRPPAPAITLLRPATASVCPHLPPSGSAVSRPGPDSRGPRCQKSKGEINVPTYLACPQGPRTVTGRSALAFMHRGKPVLLLPEPRNGCGHPHYRP